MDWKTLPLIERETEFGLEILLPGTCFFFFIQQEERNEYGK